MCDDLWSAVWPCRSPTHSPCQEVSDSLRHHAQAAFLEYPLSTRGASTVSIEAKG